MTIYVRRLFLILSVFQLIGCGTLISAQSGDNEKMRLAPYSGTKLSANGHAMQFDLPFSFVLDTLLLPVTIPKMFYDSLQPPKPVVKQLPPDVTVGSRLKPKYQTIDSYQRCLDVRQIKNQNEWCMPMDKAVNCNETSWKQLSELRDGEQVPRC